MNTLDLPGILTAVESHALASGRVERFTRAELTTAPAGRGVTAAAWLGRFAPAPGRSGLASTAGRVEVLVRLYLPAALLDAERGELALAEALDVLVGAYSGDFDLGASGRWVDLLGAHGAPMSTEAGWVRIGDQLLRVHTITVPVIVDDLWVQEA